MKHSTTCNGCRARIIPHGCVLGYPVKRPATGTSESPSPLKPCPKPQSYKQLDQLKKASRWKPMPESGKRCWMLKSQGSDSIAVYWKFVSVHRASRRGVTALPGTWSTIVRLRARCLASTAPRKRLPFDGLGHVGHLTPVNGYENLDGYFSAPRGLRWPGK